MNGHAAIYIRRSREIKGTKERPSGVSREQQEAACRALAASNGNDNPTILVDWDVSGRKGEGKRPAFAELMDMVRGAPPCPVVIENRERVVKHHQTRGKVGVVYSYDLSRLARSTRLLAEVFDEAEAHGVTIRLVKDSIDTSTATGRMIRGIIAEIAQWQADLASERSIAIIETRRQNGERIGHPNYGGRPGEDVRSVVEAFEQAGSVLGAAKLLNKRGVPTRMGGPWASSTVREILVRERAMPPHPRPGAKARAPYVLYGLLRCHCGHVLTGSRVRNGSDPAYCSYKCHMARTVPNHGIGSVPEKRILAWVREEAGHLQLPGNRVEEMKRNEAAIADLEARRGRLIDLFVNGDIDRAEKDRRLAAINDEIDAVEATYALETVPPEIDWSWHPEQINLVLRALWDHVQMDDRMQPMKAEWLVPQWRS